ncbi:hypothetical protein [Microcoleus sp. herbarium12]|uniref:hypothetical protein n=1 Tax=Microcoleus sp. herbarium12 TaxID=3055437 RepID=UPI002FD2EAE7
MYLGHKFYPRGLLLCSENDWILGCCPRYLLEDILEIISQHPEMVRPEVDRPNQPPTSFDCVV